MANDIRIKRSTSTDVPASLKQGELAYSESSKKLYIGIADSVISTIGGGGEYATGTELTTGLGTKASLASPAFTGTPTAPTAEESTNNTQVATTAYVTTAVSSLVDSAPGALDTLNELAAAINDDSTFHTTITASIANKMVIDQEIDGGTF
jgi:hypothetical protein